MKGLNIYTYCGNNPVNRSDEDGHAWKTAKKVFAKIRKTAKAVVNKVVKPAVKRVAKVVRTAVSSVRKVLSKKNGTYSSGINISGTPMGWIFNGQIGISVDMKGNVAIQASGGGGVTGSTPCISISGYGNITNAPYIENLNGIGYQIGGSVLVPIEGIPMSFGGDFNIIPNLDDSTTYCGITGTSGFGFGKPGGEFHVEWGKTVTIPETQFNIYDVADAMYIKIMEW